MKNLTLLLAITLMLVSCKSRQILPTNSTNTTIKEFTNKTLKVVDTLQVLRPSDTATIRLLLSKLTEVPTLIKSNQSTVSIRKVGDTIEATCVCDELKLAVNLYKETIVIQKETIADQKETIQIITNQLNLLQKIFFWIGLIVACTIVVLIALKFIKK